jgi:anti-anti-sigma regulatory factor
LIVSSNGSMLRIARRDGCTIVVEGEVDLATVHELVDAALGPPVARRLVMTGTTFVDGSGVAALQRIAEAAGGVLELVAPRRQARRVLELLMPDGASWFRIVEDA